MRYPDPPRARLAWCYITPPCCSATLSSHAHIAAKKSGKSHEIMHKRPSARALGYTWHWEKASRIYLNHNVLCVMCRANGRVVAATLVDHIIPHKGDMAVFWDVNNWQALCKNCHNNDKQFIDNNKYKKDVDDNGWPVDPQHPANKK